MCADAAEQQHGSSATQGEALAISAEAERLSYAALQGRHVDLRQLADRAIALSQQLGDIGIESTTLCKVAMTYATNLLDRDHAKQLNSEALALARQQRSVAVLAAALLNRANILNLAASWPELHDTLDELDALTDQHLQK